MRFLELSALALALVMLGCASQPAAPVVKFAGPGDSVTVDYVGTLDNGTVFDTSLIDGRDPLTFVVGSGSMIKGFDEAVQGMKEGDTKNINIPAKDAYGEWKGENVLVVPKANIHGEISVGSTLEGTNGMTGTVIEISEDVVKIDFNSPFSGHNLNFMISVRNITKAG